MKAHCKQCGKSFEKRKKSHIICSRKCQVDIRKKEKITKYCCFCKKSFQRLPGQLFKSRKPVKKFFCSNSCIGKYRKGKPCPWMTPELCKRAGDRMKNLWKNEEFRKKTIQNNTGETSGRWKGGRVKEGGGYTMIRIYSEHPRKKTNGYVMEHILIAEKILGRFVKKEEHIHHINEVKSDNRPENLYLFKNNSDHMSYHFHWGRTIPKITQSNLQDIAILEESAKVI